jgi:hypothetical protein
MITNEKIIELAEVYLQSEKSNDPYGPNMTLYAGSSVDIIEFARQIRRETLRGILSTLYNVSLPGENQTAISRIKMELI